MKRREGKTKNKCLNPPKRPKKTHYCKGASSSGTGGQVNESKGTDKERDGDIQGDQKQEQANGKNQDICSESDDEVLKTTS